MPKLNLDLVKNHLEKLKLKADRSEWKPYGGGNPYSYCPECEASNIQGHREDCSSLLTSELIESLEFLISLAEK